MLRNLFLKTLRDGRRALGWWALGLVALAAYVTSLWPTVRENAAQFNEFLDSAPEALRAFAGGIRVDFATGPGYLNSQVFSFIVPLLFLIFAIRLGSRATAGEEQSGTMDLLLSAPIPRVRVIGQTFGAMVAATATLGVVLWAAFAVGTSAMDMGVSLGNLAATIGAAALLGLAFGSAAMLVGALRGNRGAAVGVAASVAVGTYLMNAVAAIAPDVEDLRLFSPFHYYNGADPLRNGPDPDHLILLSLVAGILLLLSMAAFERRDVGT
ncbi:MAG TPA: ABC transporter permease subunit [Actinomycetota bacterium]|nr:ABC transporter permease subunit [Actinomycetota bacterium]